MGFGFFLVIGVKVVVFEKYVIDIDGDVSFFMIVMELVIVS